MQLLHHRIDVSPFGLFRLDLNFMYGVCWHVNQRKFDFFFLFICHKNTNFGNLICLFYYQLIGAVCTYLIILIQFDLAQQSQQINYANKSDAMATHHYSN